MAPANAEIVKKAFGSFNEGGTDALMPYLHPEIEFSTPADLASEPDTYTGHAGVRRYFDSFFEVMDRIRIEPQTLQEAVDGRVLTEMELRARGRATGIETMQPAVGVVAVRDGLIIGVSFHPDRESALAETGIDVGG